MKAITNINIKMIEEVTNQNINEKEIDAIKSLMWLAFNELFKEIGSDEYYVDVDVTFSD